MLKKTASGVPGFLSTFMLGVGKKWYADKRWYADERWYVDGIRISIYIIRCNTVFVVKVLTSVVCAHTLLM